MSTVCLVRWLPLYVMSQETQEAYKHAETHPNLQDLLQIYDLCHVAASADEPPVYKVPTLF